MVDEPISDPSPSSSPAQGSPAQLSIKCPQVLLLGEGTRDSFRWLHLLRELSLKALDAVLVLPVPSPFQPISFLRTPKLGVSGLGTNLPSVPISHSGLWYLLPLRLCGSQSPVLPAAQPAPLHSASIPNSLPQVMTSGLPWSAPRNPAMSFTKNASSNVFLNFLNLPVPQLPQFPEF